MLNRTTRRVDDDEDDDPSYIPPQSLRKLHAQTIKKKAATIEDAQSLFNSCCVKCGEKYKGFNLETSKKCVKCRAVIKVQCLRCKLRFQTNKKMLQHMNKKEQCDIKNTKFCDRCNFRTSSELALASHVRVLHTSLDQENLIKCPKCQQGFKYSKNLIRHTNDFCRQNPRFKCKFCPSEFKMKYNLESHMSIHTKYMEIKLKKICPSLEEGILEKFKTYCLKCDWTFQGVDKEKSWKTCENCKASMKVECVKCKLHFRKYGKILEHLEEGCKTVGLFHCNDCSYRTFKKRRLILHTHGKHLLLHSLDLTKCTKCEKTFKTRHHMKMHEKYCGKPAEFKCQVCHNMYKTPSILKEHLRTHKERD